MSHRGAGQNVSRNMMTGFVQEKNQRSGVLLHVINDTFQNFEI